MPKNQSTQSVSLFQSSIREEERLRLSVVVPTHRRVDHVSELLRSLATQSLPSSEWEILVVSNQEDPQLKRLIFNSSQLPCRYLVSGRKGVNSARNRGLREAKGDVILFLDDDCLPTDSRFLERHLQAHQDEPEKVGLGGAYLLPDTFSCVEEYYHFHNQHWMENSLGRDGRFSINLLGGNASYKRDWLEEHLILFDEAIEYGGAEVSFNHRLLHAGSKLGFSEKLGVVHAARIGIRSLTRKAFDQGCGLRKREQVQIQPPSCYLVRPLSFNDFLRKRTKPYHPILFLNLLNLCYDFFFQVGYRYQDLQSYRPRTALIRAWLGELAAMVFKSFRNSFFNEAYLLLKAKWVNLNLKR